MLNECRIKECGTKDAELIFQKLHLIRKLKFHVFNSDSYFLDDSNFHSTCYPIFWSFAIFNSTFFETPKNFQFRDMTGFHDNSIRSSRLEVFYKKDVLQHRCFPVTSA